MPRSLAADVSAVYVRTDHAETSAVEEDWKTWGGDIPLMVIDWPYRSLSGPLLQYLSEVRKLEQADMAMVVALLFRPGFVVTSVPTHESVLARA